jgi:hypothetical protein
MLTDLIHKKWYAFILTDFGYGGYQQSDQAVLCISFSLRLANLVRHDQAPFLIFGCHWVHHKECIGNRYYYYDLSHLV